MIARFLLSNINLLFANKLGVYLNQLGSLNISSIKVPSAKFFQLNQHNQTTKHRLNSERLANEEGVNNQNFMEQGTSCGSNELNMDFVGEP